MALTIAITNQGPAACRVALRGRLDTLTTPQLEGALAPMLDSPAVTSLVFQVEDLEYVSSAGVRCVIHAHRAMGARGGQVAVVGPEPAVRRVFEIVKALPPERIFASEAEFTAATGARPGELRSG
jgi:anti-sigma B factor antagonist